MNTQDIKMFAEIPMDSCYVSNVFSKCFLLDCPGPGFERYLILCSDSLSDDDDSVTTGSAIITVFFKYYYAIFGYNYRTFYFLLIKALVMVRCDHHR